MRILVISLLYFVVVGCSSANYTPVVLSDNVGFPVSESMVQSDIRECKTKTAEIYQTNDMYKRAMKQGLIGGVLGLGTGAVSGVLLKNKVARQAAVGSMVGSVLGILYGVSESPSLENSQKLSMTACLQRKGYDVIGWREE